ncbi:MAG: two-component system response regulator AtoC [Planctomycetota bacterium]|jgi:two-component system response regulator AtoC
MLLRILIATQDPRYSQRLCDLLDGEDVLMTPLGKGEHLWERLRHEACDLVVLDDLLLGEGLSAALAAIRALPDAPEVVVFSENDDPAHRAELLAAEAFAVVNPEVSRAELVDALQTLVTRRSDQARLSLLADQAKDENRLSDFASSSPAMREFLSLVRRVADTATTLLVLGETGVGKEYLSRAIHGESNRSDGPFVAVNCVALSESLLESELFGHVEGAFTGAVRARRGYFELAHKGTLFLDEVGELTPQLQVKLLRVLEERRIQPVGGEEEIEVDVRIITATNRDLAEEVRAKRFRSDLFYRLSVVTLDVPPLRVRREDIPGLVESNAEHFQLTMNRTAGVVREDAMEILSNYSWPGNVRELINVMERAVLLCEGAEITPQDLPPEIRCEEEPLLLRPVGMRATDSTAAPSESLLHQPFRDARRQVIETFERHYIESLLQRSHGRIKDAARIAGINTRSLYDKMQRLRIRKEYYKLNEPPMGNT